eukprot:TRINITY_DN646_c0_g1_i12.p3 TRINITY_DN646_c0_g1~~TRINITY_DN646_c0_g1_i12.p3  ORF type:complete len:117 (-),score=18.42 TRINITY_DN646_c0_g1_i12:502-852(-)
MAFAAGGALPKRILKETERLLSDPVPGINAVPHDDNARYFSVVILGPEDSPYAGGTFRLELFLPDDYPMAPPKVRFLTRLYHPNIDRLGGFVWTSSRRCGARRCKSARCCCPSKRC